MTAFVVDTNVAIVANEREIEVDAGCRLACVQKRLQSRRVKSSQSMTKASSSRSTQGICITRESLAWVTRSSSMYSITSIGMISCSGSL